MITTTEFDRIVQEETENMIDRIFTVYPDVWEAQDVFFPDNGVELLAQLLITGFKILVDSAGFAEEQSK